MIYKGKSNLALGNEIIIEGEYYRFNMPIVKNDNLLLVIKDDLLRDLNNQEVIINNAISYPFPAIYASGEGYYKLAKAFFLFKELPKLSSFSIFDNLVLLKGIGK